MLITGILLVSQIKHAPDAARKERANLETMCINGLDEVLTALQNLENDDSED